MATIVTIKDIIYDNLIELLKCRNYNIIKQSQTEKQKKHVEDYKLIDTDKAYVIYIINNNIDKKNDILTDILFDVLKNIDKKIIMITKNKLSYTILRKINAITDVSYNIEIILYNALLINYITNNATRYIRYTKMSEDDIEKFLNFYDIKRNSLPYICEDDIACIWYGFERNEIIKIEKPSSSNIITTNYRIVVSDNSISFNRYFFSNKLKYSVLLLEEKQAEEIDSDEDLSDDVSNKTISENNIIDTDNDNDLFNDENDEDDDE